MIENRQPEPSAAGWLTRLWRRLTDPDPALVERDDQRQARVLAALLLAMLVIGALSSVSYEMMLPSAESFRNTGFMVSLGIWAGMLVLYGISRTAHYRTAVVVFWLLCIIAPFSLSVPEPVAATSDLRLLAYLVIPVVVGTLFLSLRTAMLMTGFQTVAMGLAIQLFGVADNWNVALFVTMTSAAILLGAHYRNVIEQDRQQALRAAEDRYRRLVERAPFTIAIQVDDTLVYVNPAGARLLGAASPDDLIGRPAASLTHPDSLPVAPVQSTSGDPAALPIIQLEEKVNNLHGEPVEVETTIIPFIYQDQPANQIVLRDLTQQKRAEADRAASEDRHLNLVTNLPVGVFRTAADGRLLMANPALLAMIRLGLEVDLSTVLIGEYYVDPADRAEFLRRLTTDGRVTSYDVRLKQADGGRIWGRVDASCVQDDAGNILYIDGTIQDITAQVHAEQAVERSQHHSRALLKAIPDMIFELSRDGIYLDFEGAPGAEPVVPREQLLGQSVHDVVPPAIAEQTIALVQQACETGEVQSFEYDLMYDDEIRLFEARISAFNADSVVIAVRDVTESRQLTEELRRERDLVARLAETSPVGIMTLTPTGAITFVNPRAEVILGLKYEEFADWSWVDPRWAITDREGRPFPLDHLPYARVMATGESVYDVEFMLKRPDGTTVSLSVNGGPMLSAAGEIESVILVIDDVTARLQADRALRESENRYRSLFDNSLNGFALHEIITDEAGRAVDYIFLEVNRKFEEQTGLRAEDVVGQPVSEVLLVEDELIAVYGKVALEGGATRFEYFNEALNRHFEIAVFSPRPRMFATVFSDITSRVKAQQALSESEARYQELFEGMVDTVIVHDVEGNILDVNSSICRVLGYTRDELIQMHLSQVDEPGPYTEAYPERLKRQLADGGLSGIKGAHMTRDGRRVEFEINTRVITYQGQTAIMGVGRDVTERNAERALQRMLHDLVVALGRIRDLEAACEQIVDSVMQLDEVEGCAVFWADLAAGGLHLGYYRGASAELIGRFAAIPPDAPPMAIYQQGSVVFTTYAEWIERMGVADDPVRAASGLRAIGLIPIMDDDQLISILAAASYTQDEFSPRIREALLATGVQVGGFMGRLQAEQQLQASEARYRAVVEDQTEYVVRWQPDGTRLFANQAYSRAMGVALDAIYAQKLPDALGTERWQALLEKIAQLTSNSPVVTSYLEISLPDGHAVSQEWTHRGVFADDGQLVEIQSVGRDLTELVRLAGALRQERDRAQRYLDTMAVLLVGLDADGRITLLNRHGQELLGYTEAELIGQDWFATCLPENDLARVRAMFKRAVAGELVMPARFENEVRMRTGETRLIEWHNTVLTDETGAMTGALSSGQDITERRRAEIDLAESEARYRTLVSAAPSSILLVQDGRYIFVNPAGARMLGYDDPADLIGIEAMSTIASEYHDLIIERMTRLGQGQANTPVEIEVIRPDGSRLLVESSSVPIMLKGEPAMFVIGQDISERRKIALALQRREAEMRSIFRAAPIGLGVVVDRVFTWTNDYLHRMTGYSEAELIGQSARLLYADEDEFRRVGAVKYAQLEAGHPVGSIETRFVRQDGVILDVLLSSSPIDPDDWSMGVTFAALDITERKRTEDDLRTSEERLAHAQNIAHLGNWEWTLATGHLWYSQGLLDILGMEDPQSIDIDAALVMFQSMVEDDWAVVQPALDRLAHLPPVVPPDERVLPDLDVRINRRPDGQQRIIHAQGEIVCADDGTPLVVRGTLQDITARKRIEEAEREQRTMADALREIVAAFSRTLDQDELLDLILATIGQVVPHDSAHVFLVEGRKGYIARGYSRPGVDADPVSDDFQLDVDTFPIFRDMLDTREAQIISDTKQDDRWYMVPDTEWIRSHLNVPILVEGEVLGVLGLDSATAGAFTPEHAARLSVFADQAALAIRNARLYAEVQQHVIELETLHQVMIDVSSQFELDKVLTILVESATRLINADGGGIYLYDPDQDVLVWSVKVGEQLAPSGSIVERGEGLAGKVWLNSETLIVDDYAGWEGRSTQYDPYAFSAVIGVPIKWSDQFLGVFNAVADSQQRTFSARDARLLELFVNQAAVAIQKARTLDELERRVRVRTIDLSLRNKVAETLSRSLDEHEIMHDVLKTTVDHLDVAGGAIFLAAQENEPLQLAASYGIMDEALRWVNELVPRASMGGQLPVNPFVVDVPHESGVVAVLTVPIWHHERVAGVITLASTENRPWQQADMRLLDAVGRQIAVSLNTARLYTQAVQGEAQLSTILASAGDGLLVFDNAGDLILMNPAAEMLFAFYPDELGGSRQAVQHLWAWLRAQPDPAMVEFDLPTAPLVEENVQTLSAPCPIDGCPQRRVDGPGAGRAWPCWLQEQSPAVDDLHQCVLYERQDHCSIQSRSSAVCDDEGLALGEVIVLRDVTYFRELDELKGRFVSTVSHELRTPLSVVLLQVSTLLRYYDRLTDADRRSMIQDVQSQAHVLRELIEDILELSRFDANRKKPEKQWFDLVAHCHEAVKLLQPAITEKQLELDMSRCTGLRYILADPNQIMRVLRNLIGNAIKYTPAGGQIALALEQVGSQVKLAVSDTGIGISPDEKFYIFDRFFRAEKAENMAAGTGLGLSITREIVDLHGGSVDLETEMGRGSTFYVYLPISD